MAAGRIALEAECEAAAQGCADRCLRCRRRSCGRGCGSVSPRSAIPTFDQLEGGLEAWRHAGFEIFIDVNSYAKAFGELVEARRHTPSLSAEEVAALIASDADIRVLDVRRPDEYATMNIPGSVSVPGAELVLRAGHVAPDPATTIVVNCAGRTRSIIGTQSLINAGLSPTRWWRFATAPSAGRSPTRRSSMARTVTAVSASFEGAKESAREVAYRAGVKHVDSARGCRAGSGYHAYALSFRRSPGGRVCGRAHQRLSPLSGRSARSGNRHGRAGARCAHSARR